MPNRTTLVVANSNVDQLMASRVVSMEATHLGERGETKVSATERGKLIKVLLGGERSKGELEITTVHVEKLLDGLANLGEHTVLGHFETAALGLFGVLRAVGFGDVLKSAVWRLLDTALGTASFREMALWNIVPFAAHHDAGKGILNQWPEEAKDLLIRLPLTAASGTWGPANMPLKASTWRCCST